MLTKAGIILIFIALVIFPAPDLFANDRTETDNIDVVFRFDDYSATSRTELERQIFDIFRKNKAVLTVGVIPFVCERDIHDVSPQPAIALTQAKIDILRDAAEKGVVEVALHGYNHQAVRAEGKRYSEFKGVRPDIQSSKIKKGKEFLERSFGGEITTFVPPWNSYDENTILSAEHSGFKVLSGDFEGSARERDTIQFIPATSDIYKAQSAVQRARWNPSHTKQIIVILFHEYDFKESDPSAQYSVDQLSALVTWLASQDDVRIRSLRQVSESFGPKSFTSAKFLTYKKFHKVIPGFVLELMSPVGAISSEPATPAALWFALGGSVLIYGLILGIVFLFLFKSFSLLRKP